VKNIAQNVANPIFCKNLYITFPFENVGKHSQIQLRTLLNFNNSVIECIFNVGAFFIPHVNKENGTGMNSAEVKPVGTRHIQTQVNNTTQSTT
jgi:hypothetical protein